MGHAKLLRLCTQREQLGGPPGKGGSLYLGRETHCFRRSLCIYLRAAGHQKQDFGRIVESGLATTGSLTESLVGSRPYSHKSASAYWPGFLDVGPAFLGEVDHPWLESSIV